MEKATKIQEGAVGDREVVVTRVVHAPRERVWKAFATAEALAHWWGPDGFTITTSAFEFREGGKWVFIMHGPDGRDYPNWIRFTRIVEPERMEHDHGGDDDRVVFQANITLDDLGGSTRVTLHSTFTSREERDLVVKEYRAIEGGKQTLARLDEYLGMKENAPKHFK